MAYEILSESYGRRLPKIAAEADSADDLATLGTNWAEGSTCVIGDKTYSLDKVQGWVEPGSGGGGGDGTLIVEVTPSGGGATTNYSANEIQQAISDGKTVEVRLAAGSNGAVYICGEISTLGGVKASHFEIQTNSAGTGYLLTSYGVSFAAGDEKSATVTRRQFNLTEAES